MESQGEQEEEAGLIKNSPDGTFCIISLILLVIRCLLLK